MMHLMSEIIEKEYEIERLNNIIMELKKRIEELEGDNTDEM